MCSFVPTRPPPLPINKTKKKRKKNCTLGRGMGCIVATTRESGQRRVAGDGFGESAAGRVGEQMGLHAARPRRPLVPHLPSQSSELPERAENIWSFRASVTGRAGISQTEPGKLLNCFPPRLRVVGLPRRSALAAFQRLLNTFWRAAVRVCRQL